MWRNNHKTQIYKLFTHYKVVNNEIPQRIKGHIDNPTRPITKYLFGNNLLQYWQIEGVY